MIEKIAKNINAFIGDSFNNNINHADVVEYVGIVYGSREKSFMCKGRHFKIGTSEELSKYKQEQGENNPVSFQELANDCGFIWEV